MVMGSFYCQFSYSIPNIALYVRVRYILFNSNIPLVDKIKYKKISIYCMYMHAGFCVNNKETDSNNLNLQKLPYYIAPCSLIQLIN